MSKPFNNCRSQSYVVNVFCSVRLVLKIKLHYTLQKKKKKKKKFFLLSIFFLSIVFPVHISKKF